MTMSTSCPTQRRSGETMTAVSACGIVMTPVQSDANGVARAGVELMTSSR